MDDPPGEPRHRRIAYDLANKHIFVANRAMNRVEVFSSVDASHAAQISIAGASSADLSADGATVWIGTVKEQVAAIDTASLQVKALYTTSGLLPVPPVPNTAFDRPEELLALSNGRLMMRLRQAQAPEALLALWDPTSSTATNLTPAEPQLFQNGLGAMARTGDRTKVLVAANDTSGELAEFDSNGNVVEGPHGLGIGRIPLVAANADGSRFAVAFNASGNLQILLLDGSLTQIEAHASAGINGITFSRMGISCMSAKTRAHRL
jgi:DNA-binding beta-propeller fold protein YncE